MWSFHLQLLLEFTWAFYRYGKEEEVEIQCKEIQEKKKARAASFHPIRGH